MTACERVSACTQEHTHIQETVGLEKILRVNFSYNNKKCVSLGIPIVDKCFMNICLTISL